MPIEPRAILAQWHGDRVTVWSSTQVPYVARSGVAHDAPDPRVARARRSCRCSAAASARKCDFHFEGHVAALARAAEPAGEARLLAPRGVRRAGHRREGMVIELETGARADGTLVARRGRLVLDKGAYCGEGGFFAQMAAMHACGPYVIENVDVESYLELHEQPAVVARSARRPRRRCAGRSSSTWTSWPPRSGSTRSSCAAAR